MAGEGPLSQWPGYCNGYFSVRCNYAGVLDYSLSCCMEMFFPSRKMDFPKVTLICDIYNPEKMKRILLYKYKRSVRIRSSYLLYSPKFTRKVWRWCVKEEIWFFLTLSVPRKGVRHLKANKGSQEALQKRLSAKCSQKFHLGNIDCNLFSPNPPTIEP